MKIAVAGMTLALILVAAAAIFGQAPRTIIDEWRTVQAPAPPPIRPATVDPRTTALLVLDVQSQNCNMDRRPLCVASVPRLAVLLSRAIAGNMTVIYSQTPGAAVTDILLPVRPLGSEPIVVSGADKFFGTNLDQILRDRGIRTVIIVGTAAHGAVLYTASGAALRGLQVIVPVDGMSAENLFIEQYVAYHLVNAPTIGPRVTLTRTDLITF